jgi:hypothetical protein
MFSQSPHTKHTVAARVCSVFCSSFATLHQRFIETVIGLVVFNAHTAGLLALLS